MTSQCILSQRPHQCVKLQTFSFIFAWVDIKIWLKFSFFLYYYIMIFICLLFLYYLFIIFFILPWFIAKCNPHKLHHIVILSLPFYSIFFSQFQKLVHNARYWATGRKQFDKLGHVWIHLREIFSILRVTNRLLFLRLDDTIA